MHVYFQAFVIIVNESFRFLKRNVRMLFLLGHVGGVLSKSRVNHDYTYTQPHTIIHDLLDWVIMFSQVNLGSLFLFSFA